MQLIIVSKVQFDVKQQPNSLLSCTPHFEISQTVWLILHLSAHISFDLVGVDLVGVDFVGVDLVGMNHSSYRSLPLTPSLRTARGKERRELY